MPLGIEVGFGPAGHIVLDTQLPPKKGGQSPPPTNFRTVSIVAKRSFISATAELLLSHYFVNIRYMT